MRTTKFKPSEIGPIPVEWEVKRLGECGFLSRESINPQLCPLQEFWDFSMPNYDEGKRARVVQGHQLYSTKTSIHGTVLLFNKLNVRQKRIWLVDDCPENSICSSEFLPFYSEKIDLQFLSFYLATDKSTNDFIECSTGTSNSQKRITPRVFLDYLVAIPSSFSEQRRIAAVLSDTDAWIESLDKLIEKKKLVKQGTMQALLSGKTRLPGFSGKWKREAIGDEFDFLRTNTLARACLGDNGRIADVHYGDVLVRYGTILDFSTETPPFIDGSYENRSIGDFLQDGDLVVADTAEDETVGKAVEIQNLGNRQAVAGLHTVACRPKHPFAPRWLGHFANSPAFHNQLLPLISGTKVSSISKENLKTVFVLRPLLAEQAAIAEVLSDMDAELAALSREKAKAEQIKQGMMQELLTGRVRLAEGE